MAKELIRDDLLRIIGYIDTDVTGRMVAHDFYGKILGYYYPKENVTKNFMMQLLGKGNLLSALIWENHSKNKR